MIVLFHASCIDAHTRRSVLMHSSEAKGTNLATCARPSARKSAVSIVTKDHPSFLAMLVQIVVFAVPGGLHACTL